MNRRINVKDHYNPALKDKSRIDSVKLVVTIISVTSSKKGNHF